MKEDKIKGIAGRTGYCDAIMGREANNIFTARYEAQKYDAGYQAGKESGVVFFAARCTITPTPAAAVPLHLHPRGRG